MATKAFNTVTAEIKQQLKEICGDKFVLTGEDNLSLYGKDETEDLFFMPSAVVKPRTPEEVSKIFQLCTAHRIPVTPRGAGTGLSGGALPVCGGIVLSTERMNAILQIDEKNFQATVECGVITEVLQEEVKKRGLFYPPDPSSKGSCFIGGNLAESSGGPRAVKYGVTKDYVLNVQAVLPTGEILWTGANVLKNATGYNLTQLLVGSEGTLALITKAVLKLLPLPKHNAVMLVSFHSMVEACEAVNNILLSGVMPSALEFMERDAIVYTLNFLNMEMNLSPDVEAQLLVEVEGNSFEELTKQTERIYECIQAYDIEEPLFAESEQHKEKLWRIRRNIAHAAKATSVYKEEDTVVPRAALPQLIKGVKSLSAEYGFQTVCFGHAGDGNLHIFILKKNLTEHEWQHKIPEAIEKLFTLTVQLGGTISGEHGIGLVQKPYLHIALQEKQIELMRAIKKIFDPAGILNPGKIF
ncbi:MAG: FAD-binding protein [Cytophagaceae bacterium]|nr:FAD-binding protein [Cytophagaceae bacterium]MDW8455211.1 FAD-linked oxidase C-terminal domain-containing protein [Cytophagaceae bacterium]